MSLTLILNENDVFKSNSQKIRVMSELWVESNIFCPNCGKTLNKFENNRPVADFYCEGCKEEYELKSKKNTLGQKIVDGAYSTMLERISSDNNPNFFFLTYSSHNFEIRDFLSIPKHFFGKYD